MINKLVLKFIESYQKNVSSTSNGKCRFEPTCSQYAKETFKEYNFIKASFLSIKRIISCNPYGPFGYDPVEKKQKKKKRVSKK